MRRNELITLLENLEKVKNLTGVKFNYVIDKNKKVLTQEIEDIKNVAESSQDFQQYEKQRLLLLQKYAEKEPDGSPKFTQQGGLVKFDIPDTEIANFQDDMNVLIDENKSIITARDKQMVEYEKFLSEDIILEFYKLKLSDISDDINGEQFESISVFVDDE